MAGALVRGKGETPFAHSEFSQAKAHVLLETLCRKGRSWKAYTVTADGTAGDAKQCWGLGTSSCRSEPRTFCPRAEETPRLRGQRESSGSRDSSVSLSLYTTLPVYTASEFGPQSRVKGGVSTASEGPHATNSPAAGEDIYNSRAPAASGCHRGRTNSAWGQHGRRGELATC